METGLINLAIVCGFATAAAIGITLFLELIRELRALAEDEDGARALGELVDEEEAERNE